VKLGQFSLLTDENIDATVVAFLRAEGFGTRDVKEDGLIGSEDALLRLAVSESRVVLTHDSDFGTLAVAAGEAYVDIIYLRPGHIKPEFTIGTLRTLLIQNPEVNPPFIVVAARSGDVVRIRIRHLPKAKEQEP
jgi:predicted nuclease of predicted toxin-antitoxin system